MSTTSSPPKLLVMLSSTLNCWQALLTTFSFCIRISTLAGFSVTPSIAFDRPSTAACLGCFCARLFPELIPIDKLVFGRGQSKAVAEGEYDAFMATEHFP